MQFLLLNAVWFVIWIGVNVWQLGVPQFDPFPFGLLTMIVSREAIFLFQNLVLVATYWTAPFCAIIAIHSKTSASAGGRAKRSAQHSSNRPSTR